MADSANWNAPLANHFNLIDTTLGSTVLLPRIKPASVNPVVYVDGTKYPLTAAGLQAALNAGCNGTTPGAVGISAGTVALKNTSVSVPNNCDLGGGGPASLVTLIPGANVSAFLNFSSSPTNIRIHDLLIDGGRGTNVSQGCISMNNVTSPTDITIERVICRNIGGWGFNISGTAANPGVQVKVLSSKVIDAGGVCPGSVCAQVGQLYGILVSFNSHVSVRDNEISGGGLTTGISAFSSINASSATSVVDIQVVGNRIHDLAYNSTPGAAIDIGRARQGLSANNIIWNMAMGGCTTFESVWGGTIAGNRCSVADRVLTGGPIVIMIPDTTQPGEVASEDVSVVGNTIVDNSPAATTNGGITVNGAARNITIKGNVLSYQNQPRSGAYGIYLQLGTSDANISRSGQNFCKIINVERNTVVGRQRSRGAVLNGIGVQQTVSDCIVDQVTVRNNTVKGTNNGIAISSASAANGITHLYVHHNRVAANTKGISTDGKPYASVFVQKSAKR